MCRVACVVYLMGKLRSIFRPFLWALFLVMVLTPAVSSVESVLLCCGHALCRCIGACCSAVVFTLRCLLCMSRRSRQTERQGGGGVQETVWSTDTMGGAVHARPATTLPEDWRGLIAEARRTGEPKVLAPASGCCSTGWPSPLWWLLWCVL
ncbi:unnamed protein product [Durusdinium trenchii]|uniref:Uncharacterized protein n=1 Tax=Durusdinium trenchii TaxID=1381693 RepID=A0ABP0J909_9DINO